MREVSGGSVTPLTDVIGLKYNMNIAGLKNSNNFRNSRYEISQFLLCWCPRLINFSALLPIFHFNNASFISVVQEEEESSVIRRAGLLCVVFVWKWLHTQVWYLSPVRQLYCKDITYSCGQMLFMLIVHGANHSGFNHSKCQLYGPNMRGQMFKVQMC